MNTRIHATFAALAVLFSLGGCAVNGQQVDDPGAQATDENQLAKDDPSNPGTGPAVDDCEPCVKDPTSPKGGWMQCVRATGSKYRIACYPPPPPPPPPPAPTTTCSNVTEGGSCFKVCCTGASAKHCSALPCANPIRTFPIDRIGKVQVDGL